MRDVFAASEKPHQRPALWRFVIAGLARQHRIFRLKRIENGAHSWRTVRIDSHLIANFRQRAEMVRKNDANHRSSENPKLSNPKSQGNFKSEYPELKTKR